MRIKYKWNLYFKSIKSSTDEASIFGNIMFGDWKNQYQDSLKVILNEFSVNLA